MNSAPVITYTTYPGTDLRMFRCAKLSATISTTSCASRHLEAQRASDDELDRLLPCRSCGIGASHAGVSLIHYSRLYGTEICPRCGKGTTRMIRERECVSCYNRAREVISGRNAKGNAPSVLRPVFPIEVRYLVDGAPHRYAAPHATGRIELIAHLLRTTAGLLVFHWSGVHHPANAIR
jgi:hypothetical protein